VVEESAQEKVAENAERFVQREDVVHNARKATREDVLHDVFNGGGKKRRKRGGRRRRHRPKNDQDDGNWELRKAHKAAVAYVKAAVATRTAGAVATLSRREDCTLGLRDGVRFAALGLRG
jgi:hypothetical protein